MQRTLLVPIANTNEACIHSSDADSDVLADYVLALIRADSPEQELKKGAIENLDDFLRESMLPMGPEALKDKIEY